MLTAERLREYLEYDHETGIFRYRKPKPKVRVGEVAGYLYDASVYRPARPSRPVISLKIDGRSYLAHRLAWLYVTGEWPKGQIDHIDLDATNNRWVNLRAADNGKNGANRKVYA